MKRLFAIFLLSLLAGLASAQASRIKDLTVVEGGRSNQLIGYGLVVGLAGDGDGTSSKATLQSVANMLSRFGVQVDTEDIKSDNVAAVMITAEIGAFTREGTRLDVVVSSISDAKTIQGGVLLQTPLRGADNVVYAVAQGPIAVGGFLGGSGGSTVQKNHPTVGRIPGGAIVEREVPTTIVQRDMLNLLLLNPDFTTAVRMAHSINERFPGVAQATDSAAVNVLVPQNMRNQVANYLAVINSLEVIPDITARVIINERTGTIVATQNVRISKVAISHGSLTVTISQSNNVSQPNPLAPAPPAGGQPTQGEDGTIVAPGGNTVVTANTQTDVAEERGGFRVIDDLPTLDQLTSALNALGVSTRDMMSILQSLKAAGALQAELIIQ
ncbi:MAG: flagellar basal body P-ring protein FlgI [Verrucomicrobiota bacterium JB022]|nr:flagellar basal body P-ring protein FlgI [Verrucomicrobiota bacterium JB022]